MLLPRAKQNRRECRAGKGRIGRMKSKETLSCAVASPPSVYCTCRFPLSRLVPLVSIRNVHDEWLPCAVRGLRARTIPCISRARGIPFVRKYEIQGIPLGKKTCTSIGRTVHGLYMFAYRRGREGLDAYLCLDMVSLSFLPSFLGASESASQIHSSLSLATCRTIERAVITPNAAYDRYVNGSTIPCHQL